MSVRLNTSLGKSYLVARTKVDFPGKAVFLIFTTVPFYYLYHFVFHIDQLAVLHGSGHAFYCSILVHLRAHRFEVCSRRGRDCTCLDSILSEQIFALNTIKRLSDDNDRAEWTEILDNILLHGVSVMNDTRAVLACVWAHTESYCNSEIESPRPNDLHVGKDRSCSQGSEARYRLVKCNDSESLQGLTIRGGKHCS